MFYATIPRCIGDDRIRLRYLRISDSPFINDMLKDEDILKSSGLSTPTGLSWFVVWRWIKKIFTPAYCVESDSSIIGFIGLYNLELGKSAEMTLVIVDKNKRRMGYGASAFHILAQTLTRCHLTEKITVKVREDNHASIAFWRGLGFEDTHSLAAVKTMSLDLRNIKDIR